MLNLALVTNAAAGAAGGLMSFLPTMIIFAVLIYFMIIRPQKKRQTTQQNLMSSLQVGDKVQTIGGFIGEILVIDNDEFIIMSEESKLRIKKNAVAIRLTETVVEAQVVKDEEEDDDDFKIEDFEI